MFLRHVAGRPKKTLHIQLKDYYTCDELSKVLKLIDVHSVDNSKVST
jgi:hypothetical protein